jgi:putative ABC transport system permease protein
MEGITSIVSLIGTVPEYQQVRNLEMLRGRFIDENDERSRSKVCVVTELLAQKLERDPFYRETVDLHGINFKVIGVFRERVDTMGQTEVADHSAVVPLPVARYFKQSDKIDQIYVSADKLEMVPQISESIQNLLTSRHGNRSLIKVQNLTKMLKAASLITLGLTVMLLVIASISLITSGIGIMNVMLITVTERTREIGVKKAIGALRRTLLIEFLIEALILTCGGGAVGILIGAAVPFSVHFFAPAIKIEIPAVAILLGFSVTLLVGVVFGMLPALKASRLNPVDALRYE